MRLLTSEHQTLFKKFKRCVDNKSIEKMDKKLYHFFMHHCGFIAHYNLQGFRDTYEGKDFLLWFEKFANPDWLYKLPDEEYSMLKEECADYALLKASSVYEHFNREEHERKTKLLHALATELGETIENKSPTKQGLPASIFFEEGNGQLALFA